MNQHKPLNINRWLIPISWLYGFVVYMRNQFFKWGIYKRKKYDVPIFCVGNISVGGTGKTPHTEYIIRLLKDRYKVAVLSRGYKRKTNGFILSTIDNTSREIGDEPYQIKQKFPDIMVAVDRDRCRGIETLLAMETPPEVIILDDGFQHRYVEPSYVIILSDYNRAVYADKLLPAGRLREPAHYLRFATDIIITKCPRELQPIDFRIILHDVDPYPFQGLFYTTFAYKRLLPVFDEAKDGAMDLKSLRNKSILLVTGIASPKPLVEKLSEYTKEVQTMEYGDHYSFTKKDIRNISSRFKKMKSEDKIIIVTEKDAGRLKLLKNIDEEIKFYFYYIPIEVSFLESKHREEFNQRIIDHVEENRRDRGLC